MSKYAEKEVIDLTSSPEGSHSRRATAGKEISAKSAEGATSGKAKKGGETNTKQGKAAAEEEKEEEEGDELPPPKLVAPKKLAQTQISSFFGKEQAKESNKERNDEASSSRGAQAGPGPKTTAARQASAAQQQEAAPSSPPPSPSSRPSKAIRAGLPTAKATALGPALKPIIKGVNSAGRPDCRSDPHGSDLEHLDLELCARYESVFDDDGSLSKVMMDVKKLRKILQQQRAEAAAFFSAPGWTDEQKSLFLPGFLDLVTRFVAMQHFLVTSKTWADKAQIWILRLHSIPLDGLVLLLAEPFRRTIGLQSFALALEADEPALAHNFLAELSENDNRGVIYYKEVVPSSKLGGNNMVTGEEDVGSYSGITVQYRKRMYQYGTELRQYIEPEENLRSEGVAPTEMIAKMDPKPRLFARFALGDPAVPPTPNLTLPPEPSIDSFLQLVIPRLWWRHEELQETLETLSGLATHSYRENAHRFEEWSKEMKALDIVLPFSIDSLARTSRQIPLMRELPVAPKATRNKAARTLQCFVAIQDILGEGLVLHMNVNPDFSNCYLTNIPSMAAVGVEGALKVTFRGPPGLHHWHARIQLDSSLSLDLHLVPPIGSDISSSELANLQKQINMTKWPEAVLHRLLHHILTSKNLRKAIKLLPLDVKGLFEDIKGAVTEAGRKAIDATLALPDNPDDFNVEIKRRRAIQRVGADAFTGTISMNKNGQSFLLLHMVKELEGFVRTSARSSLDGRHAERKLGTHEFASSLPGFSLAHHTS